jgi:hypothetical protein
MTKNEKLNAITRLVFIITIVLYYFKYRYWSYFLLIGLGLVIVLKYAGVKTNDEVMENFTLTPTYTSTNFNQTTVAPTFAEEWHIPPPSYDMMINQAPPPVPFQDYMKPQSYPYGQYMTNTNLLPSDEYYIHMGNGSTRQAKEYANNYTLRNDLAFRDNMTKIYKKSLARRFRHNCNDTFSPFYSY